MSMKVFNALANREYLLLIAIATSAITLSVREHTSGAPAQVRSHAQTGRICAPSAEAGETARPLPADCGVQMKAPAPRAMETWV
jgi:hypothetical protein